VKLQLLNAIKRLAKRVLELGLASVLPEPLRTRYSATSDKPANHN
jgi:hypothetical protein